MINKIKRAYTFIQEEAFTVDESENWPQRLLSAFPAFKYRNYRLYFIGGVVSLIGTWLQMVAEGWLVLEITHSAFWVGVEAASATIPVLFFTLFGGVIVDRFDKKKILIFTQSSAMILALILGLLTVTHLVNLWEMIVLAFLLGCVTALDLPARQAFVVDMVEREHISSAIALNAASFNIARVIGPGVAGALIAAIGTGGAFILNGLSYIAVIVALLFITTVHIGAKTHPHPIEAIKEGLLYSFSNRLIKNLLILSALSSIFGWSYGTIMPVVVKNIFHTDAAGLGYLFAVSGLGALLAAVIVSSGYKKISSMKLIMGGNLLFALSIIAFTFASNIWIALPFQFLAGCGLLMQFSVINSTIQHMVDDKIRGRVLSIYTLSFLGMSPFGSLQIGFVAQHLGPQFAMRLGAFIILAYAIFVYLQNLSTSSKE